MPEIEAHGEISKVDDDKRLVFGWAYVTHDKDGNVAIDKSGEFVDDYAEIETAAYDFVVRSRTAGMDHARLAKDAPRGIGTMVESMVITPEKCESMGIPKGLLPTGWWVGFKIEDDAAWESVKKGERTAFSIHGSGVKKEIEDGE